jgi:hypothetical protein
MIHVAERETEICEWANGGRGEEVSETRRGDDGRGMNRGDEQTGSMLVGRGR